MTVNLTSVCDTIMIAIGQGEVKAHSKRNSATLSARLHKDSSLIHLDIRFLMEYSSWIISFLSLNHYFTQIAKITAQPVCIHCQNFDSAVASLLFEHHRPFSGVHKSSLLSCLQMLHRREISIAPVEL